MGWGESVKHHDEFYPSADDDSSEYSSNHSGSSSSDSDSEASSRDSSGSEYSDDSIAVDVTVNINGDDDNARRSGSGKSHRKGRTHAKKKCGNGHKAPTMVEDYEMPVYNATRSVARKTGSVVRGTADFLDAGVNHITDDLSRAIKGTSGVLTGQAKAKAGGMRNASAPQVKTPSAPSSTLGVKRGQVLHYDMERGHTLEVSHPFHIRVSPGAAKAKSPTTTIRESQIGHAVATRINLSKEAKPFGLVPEKYRDRMLLAQIACGKVTGHLIDPHTGLKIAELPYDIGVRYTTTPGQASSKANNKLEEHFNQQMHPNAPGMGLVGHSGASLDAVHTNSLASLLSHPIMYSDHYNAATAFDNAMSQKQTFSKDGQDNQYGRLDKSSAFYATISGAGPSKKSGRGKSIFQKWVAKEKAGGTFQEDEQFVHNFPVSTGQRICKELQAKYDNASIKHGMAGGVHFEFHPISRDQGAKSCDWDTGISSKLLSNGGAVIQITGAAKATFAIPQPTTSHEASCTVIGDGA